MSIILFSNRRDELIKDSLQIDVNFSNRYCYPGYGNTFLNSIDKTKNSGWLKNNCVFDSQFGGCIQTNGANNGQLYDVGDRIDISTSAAGIDRFDGSTNFSIFFWVKQDTPASRVFSTGSSGSGNVDNCIWQFWLSTDAFYWWNVSGGGINNITTPALISLGVWCLVGFTYSYNENGYDIIRTYKNDELISVGKILTSSHSYPLRSQDNTLQYTLGGGYYSSCYTYNSPGKFSRFILYNKCLSDNEIKYNFEQTKYKFL